MQHTNFICPNCQATNPNIIEQELSKSITEYTVFGNTVDGFRKSICSHQEASYHSLHCAECHSDITHLLGFMFMDELIDHINSINGV